MNKIGKFLLIFLSVLLCAGLVLWIIGLGVTPSVSYVKSQMYEFYDADNIDTIFVGPSTVYRALNPSVVDEIAGTNSFNLGTSSQKPIDSYYIIKEAMRVQPIKCVVLDVSQDFYVESAYTGQNQSTYLVYDRMENSSVKTEYFWSAFDLEDMGFALCKASHYDLPSISSFKTNLKAAFDNETEPDKIVYDNEWYESRGFVNSIQVYEGDGLTSDAETIYESSLEWLEKIIDLCQNNDIELYVVSSPKAQDYYKSKVNYDKNAEIISNFLESRGVTYYDFNIELDNSCFVDKIHLNGAGAEIYSAAIAELIGENE